MMIDDHLLCELLLVVLYVPADKLIGISIPSTKTLYENVQQMKQKGMELDLCFSDYYTNRK